MSKKYTPLNLSFIQNEYSPNRDSIANTAAMIMANAGWSKASQKTLAEVAKANADAKKKYNAAHRQTFLGGIFDLLQTPLYGAMNALDEAVAGHQSSNNDNPLQDLGQILGGLGTGAARGIGAGLRGASAIADVLPGVDINDEWQSNPQDKTHVSDVAIRLQTHMPTAEAMDPKNWSKVKATLEGIQNKNPLETSVADMLIPGNLDSPSAREDYFKRQMIAGIPVEILADPLNPASSSLGSWNKARKAENAAKSIEDATAGVSEAKSMKGFNNEILRAANGSPVRGFNDKMPINLTRQIPIFHDFRTPGTVADVSTVAPETDKFYKTLKGIGRRENVPTQGVIVSPKDQELLVKKITRMATAGEKSWNYLAGDLLRKFPHVKWTNTEKLIDSAYKAIDKKGLHHDPVKLSRALERDITADIASSTPKIKPEKFLANPIYDTGRDISVVKGKIKKGVGLTPQARSDAKIASKVISKFENQVLSTEKAPGTYDALANAISQGRNVRWSGPQQARMWNQLTSSLKFAGDAKYEKAARTLKIIEDYFISKGAIPYSATKTAQSVPIRLSEIAQVIGPAKLGNSHEFITKILKGEPEALAKLSPEEIQAIGLLRTKSAAEIAEPVSHGIQAGRTAAEAISAQKLSFARKSDLMNTAVRDISKFVASSGGGEVGAHVVKQYLGNITGKSNLVNAALNANRFKTEEWLRKTGRTGVGAINDPEFAKSVTRAIVKSAELPSPATLSGVAGINAKVHEWIGARFNAAYGVQDMREIFLREQSSAMATISRRTEIINGIGKRFSPKNVDMWHEAFRTAQTNGLADGAVAELQSEIAKIMEDLFGGSGLRNGAIADSTVIGRNRILMDELNRNLTRFGLKKYKFTAKSKVVDSAGVTHDLSKGIDWMRSWETWDVKDPYVFLHRIQNVVEHTVRNKNMYDEIIARFASDTKYGDVRYGVNHPRLAGYYFNKDAGQQAEVFVRMMDELQVPNSKALQHFDNVLSKLKASLTIYMPGHHFTNLLGDVYYNWIAGVNNPIRYKQAADVFTSQKGRYLDVNQLRNLAGPEALQKAIARGVIGTDTMRQAGLTVSPQGQKVVLTMRNGTKVTADMVYTAMYREGVLPSAKVLEDIEAPAANVLDKWRPLGGRGQEFVHSFSEARDHVPRIAQFIDMLAKHGGSFNSAIKPAAAAVRKWHPDGLDITNFERRFMKRVFPFYSWTRKSIPLAIESTIFSGPKVMAYPRLVEMFSLYNGIQPNQLVTDPFPNNTMVPDWLRMRGIGPLGMVGGDPNNLRVVNPSTPVLDVLSLVGNPGQGMIDMLNPMAKVPVEIAQGQTLGRNIPIQSNQQWIDYLTKQIPVASQLGRATGQVGTSDSTRAEGFPNWMNIINMLTGAKAVDTGKYRKSAQFDLRDYLKQKKGQQFR